MPTLSAADCFFSSGHDDASAALVGPVGTGAVAAAEPGGADSVTIVVLTEVEVVVVGPAPLCPVQAAVATRTTTAKPVHRDAAQTPRRVDMSSIITRRLLEQIKKG
jgi:hypothetical protein